MNLNPADSATSEPVAVDICVCSFRRTAALERLLRSLVAQRGAPPFQVIVADNHSEPELAARIAEWRTQLGLRLHYVHAPERNISIARNACLDAAQASWLVFVDDDEIAEPDWLATLLRAGNQADVVFGPVLAIYGQLMPLWLREGDFHSKQPVLNRNAACDTGYTANVLIRRSAIGACRFDPKLGRTGGEDTLFFAQMAAEGARLRYCAGALMHEPVPAERASLRWLSRRAFASGQAHARVLRLAGPTPMLAFPLAALKAGYCTMMTLLTLPRAVAWRRHFLRGRFHLGVLSGLFGGSAREIYGGG